MKPEIKKQIILHLPYLAFVYLFGKIGQAFRLAQGADLSAKLLHIGQGFSVAFASAAPSFHPADLLIGFAAAVIIRLVVYSKQKNAKKYRKGMEYGTARWGTAADIKPFDPSVQPVVTILWSESDKLKEGEKLPLARADTLFQTLDAERRAEREKPGHTGGWYDKTAFRIDFTMNGEPDHYEGRQDFGDGDGSLIDHIQAYHEYYAKDEHWENYVLHNEGAEAWEQDKTQREMILNEFVPYLRLHCNLSEQERTAAEVLENGENLTPEQAAYFNAVLTHVDACREKLNAGEYHLPDPPQRIAAAFQSLQAPNSPNGTHFMVEVSPHFERIASSKEHERLQRLLPYKSLCLSSMNDRQGIYALIGKDEKRDLPLRRPRPSVRAQLKAGQPKAAAPKKTAAKKKKTELEV